MFTQHLTVTFTDDTVKEVTTTQADVAAWEMFCMNRKMRASGPDRTTMQDFPVTFLRFLAYNALNRPGTGKRPDFDLWSADVTEVMLEETVEADPTQKDTQDA